MPRPAIFFDRDNTLIRNSGYLRNHREVVLLPGAAGAVAACRKLGFATITVSNQSGVARAMMSEADVRTVNARMDELLLDTHREAVFDDHYFCPYHPDPAVASVRRYCVDSDLRKPKPGMLLRAAEEHDLDLARSWMIGDAARDVEAGQAAGCRTILLRMPDVEASVHATDDDGGAEFVA
ncbi:MAG: HAD family hydrolase, partial [Planctomycetota bacterium]